MSFYSTFGIPFAGTTGENQPFSLTLDHLHFFTALSLLNKLIKENKNVKKAVNTLHISLTQLPHVLHLHFLTVRQIKGQHLSNPLRFDLVS